MDEFHSLEQQSGEIVSPPKRTENSTIENYYDKDALIEWQRLERHRIEFAITMRALTNFLPSAPQSILDIGGGPGRYVLALSALKYQVTLLDLSQGNLTFAQQKARETNLSIQQYVHGNALTLSSLNLKTFDIVLLLGPLYHLLTRIERQQALREAWQILRPGGLIFTAFITRYAPFRDIAKKSPHSLLEERATWEEILRIGVYHADQGVGFTNAYFAHPAEIVPLMEEAGFETLDVVGCEGIIAQNEEQINQLTDEAWQAWVDLNYQLGKEPSLYGAADHLLYVGRKPNV